MAKDNNENKEVVKKIEDENNLVCSFITGKKDAKGKRECKKIFTNCKLNKCKDEKIRHTMSSLTDEDIKQCDDKYKNNWKKSFGCKQKLLKTKGFFDADAKYAHCVANKCPETLDFAGKGIKNLVKNMLDKNKSLQEQDECMKKECPKEYEVHSKAPNNIELSKVCNKKYDTYKGQSTCANKIMKPYMKNQKQYQKCFASHCKKDENTKKLMSSKRNSTKKNTHKSH